MMRKWWCQADVTLRLVPIDPILIKSGYATVDGPDMVPVSTMRGQDGKLTYYFPGTSLKGVLRSHLERIARTLRPGSVCLPYYEKRGGLHIPVASERDSVSCGYRFRRSRKEDTTSEAYADSCPACRMFGSLKFGGRFSIGDAYPVPDMPPRTEARNGVAIDRFTGGTVPGLLFELLVLVGGEFETKIRLVNFELWQLAALGFLLLDLGDELIQIGSGRSRGLGRVRGQVTDYRITYVRPAEHLLGLHDLADPEDRTAYSLHDWRPATGIPLSTPANTRGLRHEYNITSSYADILTSLAPAFEDFLKSQGGLKPALSADTTPQTGRRS
jgi:CRISPR/Cas system CSM-associated protein Csm3 (group 7 of RAMP superfamily)